VRRRQGLVDREASNAYRREMPMTSLKGLTSLALQARSWPFEQARALLARVVKLRLATPDAREAANALIAQGDVQAALTQFPDLGRRPVLFETGYGPSGLPILAHSARWPGPPWCGPPFAP